MLKFAINIIFISCYLIIGTLSELGNTEVPPLRNENDIPCSDQPNTYAVQKLEKDIESQGCNSIIKVMYCENFVLCYTNRHVFHSSNDTYISQMLLYYNHISI